MKGFTRKIYLILKNEILFLMKILKYFYQTKRPYEAKGGKLKI